jgi:hypothetical protein
MHGRFGLFQRGGGFFGSGVGDFLLGVSMSALRPGSAARCGRGPGGIRFQACAFGFFQVVLQLAQTLLAVLDALLDPGNIAAHRIEAACTKLKRSDRS